MMLKWSVVLLWIVLLWSASLVRCSTGDGEADTEEDEEPHSLLEFVKTSVRTLVDNNYDSLSSKALSIGITPYCGVGLLKFMNALRNLEPWAARFIDASGKYPTGLFQGTLSDYGAYDECIETVVRDDDGQEKIRAQYCTLHIKLSNDTSLLEHLSPGLKYSHPRTPVFAHYQRDPRVQGLTFGVCIPTFCTNEDVEKIAKSVLLGSSIEVPRCVTNEWPPINTSQACIIAFLAVLAALILVCSLIDIFYGKNADKEARKGIGLRLATIFSAPASTRLLLAIEKNENAEAYRYRFLHGIRFFSMFMIILGHSYSVFNFANVTRLVNALHYGDDLSFTFIMSGYLSVDTFLFLGGFLLTYNLQKEKAHPALAGIVAILRRYIRGTVPAFFVIMFFFLLPLLISGPSAALLVQFFHKEMGDQWWAILLQIRNLTKGLEYGAFGHLWYLSTDFQLFTTAVIVLQLLKGRRWWTMGALAALTIACNSFCTWQMNYEVFTPFVMPMADTFRTLLETLNDMYTLPTTHAPAFFIGCIASLLVLKYKEVKMSRVWVATGWMVGTAMCFAAIFTMHFWLYGEQQPIWANMLFAFWNRTVWAMWLGWLTFACSTGRGGLVTRFLSWAPFVPLSRLCFGVYLVHLPFYFVINFTAREKLFFSHFTMVNQCFAVAVWSYLMSYLVFIACEVPVGRIEKMILMRDRPRKLEDASGDMRCLENGYKPSKAPTDDKPEDSDSTASAGQSSYL